MERFIEFNNKQYALEELYESNKKKFMRLAEGYNLPLDDKIDIFQDAIIALIELNRKGKLAFVKSDISTYLLAIAKYMLFKKAKVAYTNTLLQENMLDVWEEYNEQNEIQLLQMQKAWATLGEQCKKLLTAFYYEEKKLDDLVKLMGYDSKDVAKSQKSRCIKQLKIFISTINE